VVFNSQTGLWLLTALNVLYDLIRQGANLCIFFSLAMRRWGYWYSNSSRHFKLVVGCRKDVGVEKILSIGLNSEVS